MELGISGELLMVPFRPKPGSCSIYNISLDELSGDAANFTVRMVLT